MSGQIKISDHLLTLTASYALTKLIIRTSTFSLLSIIGFKSGSFSSRDCLNQLVWRLFWRVLKNLSSKAIFMLVTVSTLIELLPPISSRRVFVLFWNGLAPCNSSSVLVSSSVIMNSANFLEKANYRLVNNALIWRDCRRWAFRWFIMSSSWFIRLTPFFKIR